MRVCFVDTVRREIVNPQCLSAETHTPQPVDYCGFFEWAREMSKTHVQRRCSSCDLLAVWVERVPCSECGRRYAPISDGTPRSHRAADGRGRCAGAQRGGGLS